MNLFSNLDTSRDTFAKIHNAVRLANLTTPVADLVAYFNHLRKLNLVDKTIKYNQYMFFLMLMEELGIMRFVDGVLELNKGIKTNLSDSAIYNFVIEFLKIKG